MEREITRKRKTMEEASPTLILLKESGIIKILIIIFEKKPKQ